MSKLDLSATATARLLLGVDRDGTIVPYAPTPAQAIIAPAVKDLLRKLSASKGIILAIISARSIEQLKEDVGDSNIILAGNYGLKVRFPDGEEVVQQDAIEALPELKQIRLRLQQLAAKVPNCILEDQTYALHIHYRNVAPGDLPTLHKEIASLAETLSLLKLNSLPTSYEFFPSPEWNKGKGLELLRNRLNLVPGEFYPIFIGDTEADEPAFSWSNQFGGFSARVAPYEVTTQARELLANPEEAIALLQQILESRSQAGTVN